MLRGAILILLVCTSLTPCYGQAQNNPGMAFHVAGIVDIRNGRLRDENIVYVENGVVSSFPQSVPEHAILVDRRDLFLAPGLIDAHTHLFLAETPESYRLGQRLGLSGTLQSALEPDAYRVLNAAKNAADLLAAGFTTIRDLGNAGDFLDVQLARAIDDGLVAGPRLLPVGKSITPRGAQFRLERFNQTAQLFADEYLVADTQEELLLAVREVSARGAAVVKVIVDDQRHAYTVAQLSAVVTEAHAAGLKVAAHCVTQQGAARAIEAGVNSIEHGPFLSDDMMQAMRDKRIFLVGTEFSAPTLQAMGAPAHFHEILIERLRRAKEMGVPIAYGTDIHVRYGGLDRGILTRTQITSFREAGFSPAETLQAMTVSAAGAIGLAHKVGAIEPGMWADFIGLLENPLMSETALDNVQLVVKAGKVVTLP